MIFLTLTLVNKLIKEIEIKTFIVFIFFRKEKKMYHTPDFHAYYSKNLLINYTVKS
jgi:hypothetical protein